MLNQVYLLLGSNEGDKKENLQQAIMLLEGDLLVLKKKSQVYESMPWGNTEQPPFYNQVLCVECGLSPDALLAHTQATEQKMGRERKIRWGQRNIDIDILYYENLILTQEGLIIPHPEIQNRRFTLMPLAEIAPDLLHPVLKKNTIILLEECQDLLEVKPINSP